LLQASDRVDSTPTISIGVPVYNGAALLANALDSILAQSFTDFEVIVSDNASTDATADIARAYALADPRVRYVRQPVNLGPLRNFEFVLTQAVGEYFLWAAVDDTRSSDFLQINHEFLSRHLDFVGSVSATVFEDGPPDPIANGDGLLDNPDLALRLERFLEVSHANSGFYSLFRREPLVAAMTPIAWYFGFDWTIMLRLAVIGPMARLEDGWCRRGAKGLSTDTAEVMKSNRVRRINWLIPFYDFSIEAMKCARAVSPSAKRRILYLLTRLNYRAFRAQMAFTFGRKQRCPERAQS
jgi:glycosyltransferase involved in cell wall biosynthesis